MRRRGLPIVMVVAVAAGCSGPRGEAGDGGSGPPETPTVSTSVAPVVMTAEDAFTVALAAVPPTRQGWGGPGTGELTGLTICADRLATQIPDGSVFIQSQHPDADPDGAVSQPLERVLAAVAPIPEGSRKDVVDDVAALVECDGTSDGRERFTASARDVDGVEVVTVGVRERQGGAAGVAHQVIEAQVVDGLLVVCGAVGTDRERATQAGERCGETTREAVEILRGGLPEEGSIASAAVLAGRMRATPGTTAEATTSRAQRPCYGEDVRTPDVGVVAAQLTEGESMIHSASVLVQPFTDAAAARREVARYQALVADCRGEYLLSEATRNTPEVVVTRTRSERTDTGDGGARFASFFGTDEERTGTTQVTEVFAFGPHLVYASSEGQDDADVVRWLDRVVSEVTGTRGSDTSDADERSTPRG